MLQKYNTTHPQLQFKCIGGKGRGKEAYQLIFLRLLDRIQRIGFNPQVGHIFSLIKIFDSYWQCPLKKNELWTQNKIELQLLKQLLKSHNLMVASRLCERRLVVILGVSLFLPAQHTHLENSSRASQLHVTKQLVVTCNTIFKKQHRNFASLHSYLFKLFYQNSNFLAGKLFSLWYLFCQNPTVTTKVYKQ